MTTRDVIGCVCPNCLSVEGVALSADRRLCFDCRHEWNPADAPTLRAVPEPDPATPVDDILGPPAEVLAERDAHAALDALLGTEVILEGGQRAFIQSFPDNDHVTVDPVNAGDPEDFVTVDFNDVIRSVEMAAPVVDLPTEDALALAATVGTVAALTLRAGIAMISGEGDNRVIGLPPTGWLPEAKGTIAITEQGVAYAVAILLHACNIDTAQASAFADDLWAEVTNEPPKGDTQ